MSDMAYASFSWKHYAKPTPVNLLYWAGVMRDTVTFAATLTILMEASIWVPEVILITGFVLDKAKNFFAMVEEDVRTESTTAVFPSGGEVTVTQDVPNKPLDSGDQEI